MGLGTLRVSCRLREEPSSSLFASLEQLELTRGGKEGGRKTYKDNIKGHGVEERDKKETKR